MSDPRERDRWITSMRERVPDGPLAVGVRIPARRSDPASRSTYELTVTVLDPPSLIETSIRRNGAPAGRAGYEVRPAPGGAIARAFAEFELSGLQRLLGPIVAANLQREMDADLASLKRHVEGRG